MGQRPRKRDELLLPGGKSRPALANLLLKSFGQRADEVTKVHILRGLLNLFIANPLRSQPNISADRAAEQERILQHHAKSSAQLREIHCFHIDPISPDALLVSSAPLPELSSPLSAGTSRYANQT